MDSSEKVVQMVSMLMSVVGGTLKFVEIEKRAPQLGFHSVTASAAGWRFYHNL